MRIQGLMVWSCFLCFVGNATVRNASSAFVTDQDASVVIGQVDFTSSGYSCSDSTLCDPRSIYVDSLKRLYIADYGNNRVLIYDSIPVTNNAHADAVVGQVDMNSNAASVSDSTFNQPMSVFSDGKGLFIADFLNHRVLIYNTIPTSNNAHADVVVGQVDMNSNTQGCSDSTLCLPVGVFSDGTRLFIAD